MTDGNGLFEVAIATPRGTTAGRAAVFVDILVDGQVVGRSAGVEFGQAQADLRVDCVVDPTAVRPMLQPGGEAETATRYELNAAEPFGHRGFGLLATAPPMALLQIPTAATGVDRTPRSQGEGKSGRQELDAAVPHWLRLRAQALIAERQVLKAAQSAAQSMGWGSP